MSAVNLHWPTLTVWKPNKLRVRKDWLAKWFNLFRKRQTSAGQCVHAQHRPQINWVSWQLSNANDEINSDYLWWTSVGLLARLLACYSMCHLYTLHVKCDIIWHILPVQKSIRSACCVCSLGQIETLQCVQALFEVRLIHCGIKLVIAAVKICWNKCAYNQTHVHTNRATHANTAPR